MQLICAQSVHLAFFWPCAQSCCASCGATGCYLLSSTLARGLVKRFFSYKLATFRGMIQENKRNLFFYLLFLRATPLMPNWYHLFSSLFTKCLAQGFLLMSLFFSMSRQVRQSRLASFGRADCALFLCHDARFGNWLCLKLLPSRLISCHRISREQA